MTTPKRLDLDAARAQVLQSRAEKCWSQDIDWDLYPVGFKEVRKLPYILIIVV